MFFLGRRIFSFWEGMDVVLRISLAGFLPLQRERLVSQPSIYSVWAVLRDEQMSNG